jgi:hypothetical protein
MLNQVSERFEFETSEYNDFSFAYRFHGGEIHGDITKHKNTLRADVLDYSKQLRPVRAGPGPGNEDNDWKEPRQVMDFL